MKLENLEKRLQKAEENFDRLYNDDKTRNISFVSAGCLSNSSRKNLDNNSKQMFNEAKKIELLKLAIKVIKEDPFTLREIDKLQRGRDNIINVYITPVGIMAKLIRDELSKLDNKFAMKANIKIDLGEG